MISASCKSNVSVSSAICLMQQAIRKDLPHISIINIQSSFTVKSPRVRLVEIGHMTTLCVSIPQSLSAVIKSNNALQLLQLSIHSKTVQIFIQVLVMNSVPLIYFFLNQEWLRNNFPSENLDDLSAAILAAL